MKNKMRGAVVFMSGIFVPVFSFGGETQKQLERAAGSVTAVSLESASQQAFDRFGMSDSQSGVLASAESMPRASVQTQGSFYSRREPANAVPSMLASSSATAEKEKQSGEKRKWDSQDTLAVVGFSIAAPLLVIGYAASLPGLSIAGLGVLLLMAGLAYLSGKK